MFLRVPVMGNRSQTRELNSIIRGCDLPDHLKEGFAVFLRDEMVLYCRNVIHKQKYKKYWKPLNKDYLKAKKEAGLSTNIWEATSLLVDNITYYKQGNYYVICPNKKVIYPNSTLSVYDVAVLMESGTSRMPARPLFKWVVRDFIRSGNKLLRKYLQEVGEEII